MFFVSCRFYLSAQDIHWSQFNDNQLWQNPGNAGHFKGDYRFIGNFRDQWRSVTVPYSTFSGSADTRLKKDPSIGIGGLFFHDVVGDGNFRTIELNAFISKQLKFTSDSMHIVRPGIILGLNHRQVNFDNLYFDSQFDGMVFNSGLPSNETNFTDRKTNFTLGLGAIYQYYRNERFVFQGGLGFYNLNTPNQGFYTDNIPRDIRTNISGKGIYKLNFDWDLIPGINVNLQGKYREIQIGSSVKYTLENRLGSDKALYGGLWFRNRDAAYITLGIDYQNLFAGISYDINFSKLVPASHARGGVEIAVRYIIFSFKPKKIVHRICPDYI